ncbi:MAG: hypothetical protein Q4B65_01180 [Candidatus Saccharibacteria bacterium]|nr:hypothetical protein [Candidatus Saccharibacteria bacterium]
MAKVLNIIETKIVMRNNIEVQRVIFSDDKIVYVRTDNGEVYPTTTPDKYVDLISTFNASHQNIVEEKPTPKGFLFDEPVNYIKNGSTDRAKQIEKTKDGRYLSKNRDTQKAINGMRNFGTCLTIVGVFDIAIAVIYGLILSLHSNNANPSIMWANIISACISAVIYLSLGSQIYSLKMTPGGIKTTAIIMVVLTALVWFIGANGVGIAGIFVFIYAVIALTKISTYEGWYYGEID